MFKCTRCEKEFKTKQALGSHIGWHNKPKRNVLRGKDHPNFGKHMGNQFTKMSLEKRFSFS